MTATAVKPNPAANRRARMAQQSADATHGVDSPATSLSGADAQSYVPPMEKFTSYHGRKIAGVDFVEVFDYAAQHHYNVLLEGPTGSGKTSAVVAYAAHKRKPFYALSSSVGLEPSQLFGKYIPDADTGGFVWIDGPLTTLVRHGGVLLLNEMNFIPERIATVLFSLLDFRREITLLDHKGEVVKAHPDLVVFGDMNPDYAGTRPLNAAFRNRFAVKLTWEYEGAVEKKLVQSEALLTLAAKLRQQQADGTFETPCSTNSLVEFEANRAGLGYDFAVYNFVQGYSADEREAVTMLFTTARANLLSDYRRIDAAAQAAKDPAPAPEKPADPVVSTTFDATWGIDTADLDWVYDATTGEGKPNV